MRMRVISDATRNFTSNFTSNLALNSKFRCELQVARIVFKRASQITRAEVSRHVRYSMHLNLSIDEDAPPPSSSSQNKVTLLPPSWTP